MPKSGALFLHDNAPAHRALATKKKLAYLVFQCLDHLHYSPDLAPSDLFPGPGWTENVLNFFFESLAKVGAMS